MLREKEIRGLCIVLMFVALGYLYTVTDYTKYTAVAVNEEVLSEEIFTIKIYDSKRVDSFNLTEIRYIDSYSFLGEPRFKTIKLITNQTIYPDDKIQLSKTVIMTDCEWYQDLDGQLISFNSTFPLFHSLGYKVNFSGDYDKCDEKMFYKLLDNNLALQKNTKVEI